MSRLHTKNGAIHNNSLGVHAKRYRTPVLAFVMLVIALCSLGIMYLIYETKQLKASIRDDLTTIADLKATQISNWKKERTDDAKELYETPMFQQIAAEYLENRQGEQNKAMLTQWMNVFYKQNDYTLISLLDAEGKQMLSVPEGKKSPYALNKEYLYSALKSGKIVEEDLYREKNAKGIEGSRIFFSYWIPVFDPVHKTVRPKGAWLVQIDPTKSLYPMIQSWQGSSKTAETLLVRREGNDVLFLNELRHTKNTAMKLRYKLEATPNLPATMAVMGKEGTFEGVDYRGVPVISAIRKVYGTPWFMVAKIDKAELYLPLRKRVWLISITAIILLLAIAQSLGMMERKRDEAWLKQQLILEQDKAKLQEDYRKIALEWQGTFDSISDAIWLLDKDNKIIRANSSTTNSLGLNSEQLIGQHCGSLMHKEGCPPEDCPFPRMLSTKARAATEIKLLDRWMSVSVDPILDENKELIGAVHIMRDITSQKLLDKALRESETTLSELFEHMSSGVFIYEPSADGKDFRVVSMNSVGEKITGTTRAKTIGSSLLKGFPTVVEMGLFDKLLKVSQTGNPEQFPTTMYQDGKPVAWHENYVLRLDSGYVVVIFDDVTKRVQSEAAITKLNEELEEHVEERTAQLAEANKELEAFSYSVSHDLRSPLFGIAGWSQALLEDYDTVLDEQGKKYLERVIKETQRMGQLIEGLLKLAQINKTALKPEHVNLSQIVTDVLERLQEEQPERKIELVVQPGLSTLGDSHLLEIVLTNLLNNAWKFTTKAEHAKIEFGETMVLEKPAYYVRDNGAGFDMAYASKLFEAFQRLHKTSDYPGTGIGLATVRRIITRHGGRLWADAKPNEGATFYFTIQELS